MIRARLTRLPVVLLGLMLSCHVWGQVPDDPAQAPFPQPGFATDARALVIQVLAVDDSTYEFLGAVLSLTPPGASFAAPSQLGVVGLDGEGRALVVRNAPYPRWVFDQDGQGNEFKTELPGEIGYIAMPFDPALRDVRIVDLETGIDVAAIDLEPSLVKFCLDGDLTDQAYCGQFPCFNDPGLPGCVETSDNCPADPLKTEPGLCGCGIPDTDGDLDGTPDCLDFCPADSQKLEPGSCGCGAPDNDGDGDGTADCIDQCPADGGKDVPGACGCGVADDDGDADGVADCLDNCPALANGDQADNDGDGLGNVCDPTPDGEPVAGDLTGDGLVDGQDYAAIRSALGRCEGDAGYLSAADFTGDRCVAFDDYQYWYGTYFAGEDTGAPAGPGC